MPGYQIYIPKARGASPDRLAEVGLELADPAASVQAREVWEHGPDGGAGVVFYWPDLARPELTATAGVDLRRQEWTPAKPEGTLAAGRFWMGRERGQPVEPESLLRRDHKGGLPVKLADGQEWLIPAARQLPRRYTLDERGVPTLRVDGKYQAWYEQAERYVQKFLGFERGQEFDLGPEVWSYCVFALALNYRVDSRIVDWLGLLSTETVLHLVGATFEWSALSLASAQKKTAEL